MSQAAEPFLALHPNNPQSDEFGHSGRLKLAVYGGYASQYKNGLWAV
jgi:hypothetical protein